MVNMIIASSKVPISSSPSSPIPKPRIPFQISIPKIPSNLQKLTKPQLVSLSSSLSAIVVASLALAPPSLAEEFEKGALFDFNLTLPIQIVQFLLLMVVLDKLYYSPLGKFRDERDSAIREKLGSVKDTLEEVKQLEEQGIAIKRAEISMTLTKIKKETQGEVEEKLAEGRKKVEVELQEMLAKLEEQKEETMKALDFQIANLNDQIIKKVLPL
ncbi:ATP synthase subunit b', chloroplastic-like [Pyrus communis]|uniref:ATP synthase subunit b', chloroplastic-like n=1 Tax=Pyrus communis TaxID=23211 RepID=UPI0035BFDA84